MRQFIETKYVMKMQTLIEVHFSSHKIFND